jgi:TolA-binding protein
MSKDLLAEATRALRETEPVSEFEARATRTRVLTGLHQTRVRRRTRLAFLLPIAACFVAVSAWGAGSGQARRVLDQLEQLVGITVSTPSAAKTSPRRLTTSSAPAVRSSEPALLAPSPEAEPAPTTASAARPTSSARATASSGPVPRRTEQPDPTLALYRLAHAAHFVDHDPARALAAWDAYLSAAPNGGFAPEARYNRALSLVRLGRSSEARVALEPFANGAYGGYRKAEASALLARIEP